MGVYIKLKPCPFCKRTFSGDHNTLMVYKLDYYYVNCPRCNCHGPTTTKGFKYAQKLWNDRKSPMKKVKEK